MAVNVKLVTPFIELGVKDRPMADPTLLDPTNANPLVDGEFLELDGDYKFARGAVDGALVPSYMVFMEAGRTDAQAIGKTTVLFLHSYEADTMIFDPAGLALHDKLCVGDVDIGGGIIKRGLQKIAGAEHVIGYVSRLPASNGGYLRFVRTA